MAPEIAVCALIYLEVALRRRPHFRRSTRRAAFVKLIAASLLAAKWLDDDHPENDEWGIAFKIPLKEKNKVKKVDVAKNNYEEGDNKLFLKNKRRIKKIQQSLQIDSEGVINILKSPNKSEFEVNV